MEIERCAQCLREFPSELILGVCPVCALENRNEIHGLPPETQFQGEQARANYDSAIEFLKSKKAETDKEKGDANG